MSPESTGPDDRDRTKIDLVYPLFEVLSVVQDGRKNKRAIKKKKIEACRAT